MHFHLFGCSFDRLFHAQIRSGAAESLVLGLIYTLIHFSMKATLHYYPHNNSGGGIVCQDVPCLLQTAQRGKIHQDQNNIAYFMAHYENTRARLECAGGYVSKGWLGVGIKICAKFTQKRFRKCAQHDNPVSYAALLRLPSADT